MSIFNFNLQPTQSQSPGEFKQKIKNGFMLFEVGVVLVLVVITSLIIMSWFSRILEENILSKSRLEAVFYASDLIEKFYVSEDMKFNLKLHAQKIEKDKYKVDYKISKDNKLSNYRHLQLKIFWDHFGREESVVFEAGKIL